MKNAPSLNPRNFTAMVRLDHNRALSQLAEKTGTHTTDLRKVIIWGNHSATQYPDLHHATVARQARALAGGRRLVQGARSFPIVQQRGAAIIKARGASSAASAASAAIDHMHTWVHGTAGRRLGQHGRAVRRQLRHPGGRDLRLSRSPARTATTRSCRASRSTISAAARWTRPTRNCSRSATGSRTSSDLI